MQGNYALKYLMAQNILTHNPYIHVLVKLSMLFALNRLQLLYYIIYCINIMINAKLTGIYMVIIYYHTCWSCTLKYYIVIS